MTPIETYLLSPQAVEDVTVRICDPASVNGRWAHWDGKDVPWAGTWKIVALEELDAISVYFCRLDEARYVVTDLGEGWQAYTLRTKDLASLASVQNSPGVRMSEGRLYACSVRGGTTLLTVGREDLSPAIVRVMLASYRLACLFDRSF